MCDNWVVKKFGFINYTSVIILALSLVVFSSSLVIHRSFRDIPSMLNFFERANVYVNLSEIVKLEIEENYPPELQQRVLVVALVDKLVDYVVTPQLIERAAEPFLKLSVKFAQQPVSIVSDKVVVSTAKYKEQFTESLSESDLPPFLVSAGQSVITAIPAQLTLVDNQKHPDNVLAKIIKLRDALEHNEALFRYSKILIFVAFFVLLFNNLRRLRTLLLALTLGIGIPALAIVIASLLAGPLMSALMPATSGEMAALQNKLITDVLLYLFLMLRNVGIALGILGIFCLALWKFVPWQRPQARLDTLLNRFHGSVKVKKSKKEVTIKV